jgi:hypothetical protein
MRKCRFVYYAQEAGELKPIEPRAFPRQIATQNMWLDPNEATLAADGHRLYALSLVREMNPEDPYFWKTLTAQVWVHLLTGKDYYQTVGGADPQQVREFAEKYHPIRLPEVVKTPADWPGHATTRASKS